MNKEYGMILQSIMASTNDYVTRQVKKYGLKQGQVDYLILIANYPNINQLELTKKKNVGKASVTKALKILEEDGFISREVDPKDKRNFLCKVTPKGEKIISDLVKVKNQTVEVLFSDFTKEEKESFYNQLLKLEKNSKKL